MTNFEEYRQKIKALKQTLEEAGHFLWPKWAKTKIKPIKWVKWKARDIYGYKEISRNIKGNSINIQ